MGKILNPVITGFNPDPSICRFDGSYYLATSTFEYFPAIAIYKSDDLVNFKLVCNALDTNALDLNNCGHMSGVYAATLRSNNGVMYMITTNSSGQGHMYVSTTDPDNGNWSEPIFVKGRGFDPDLFFDDDGKTYFLRQDFGGYGIFCAEIDIETGNLLTDEKLIYTKFEDKNCEAPHLYKLNGYYYLFVAEGGTYRGHMAAAARSKTPLGNYELCPHNPILTHRCEVLHEIQSCGHMDFISDQEGNFYAYFLATRPNGHHHHLGRETFIAPMHFDDHAWPHINNGQNVELVMDIEALPDRLTDEFVFDADFSSALSPHFITRRNPRPNSYFLSGNALHLLHDRHGFGSMEHRSFWGIRQKNFSFTLTAEIVLDSDGTAGICAVMSDSHHYDLCIKKRRSAYSATVRKTVGDISSEECIELYYCDRVILKITGDRDTYKFYVIRDETEIYLGSGMTYLLSAETASTFNGVVLGMFAEGDGNTYARFLSLSYRGIDRTIIKT